MQCDSKLFSTASTSFSFLSNPSPSSSPSFSSNRIFFPSQPPFSTLKARATINNGGCTKPISDMSFYELLEIPQHVDFPEIKKAYKQLARKYHPDVSPSHLIQESTDRFIRVQEAYEVLSDPRKREMYDRDMARGLHLAFSARKKMYNYEDQETDGKTDWRGRWESQLSELKRRSMYKDAKKNTWGARMRNQRNVSSS